MPFPVFFPLLRAFNHSLYCLSGSHQKTSLISASMVSRHSGADLQTVIPTDRGELFTIPVDCYRQTLMKVGSQRHCCGDRTMLRVVRPNHGPYCWTMLRVSFEPRQSQRIISGLKTNFNISPSYSFRKSLYLVSFSKITTR